MLAAKREHDGIAGCNAMKSGNPCIDCRSLLGTSLGNEPHLSLELRSAKVLAPSDPRYYECMACGAILLREQQTHDPRRRWRLL